MLRLRIFAGPNGSGKSIMKRQVERTVISGRRVDLGVYVNADDIARELLSKHELDLATFRIKAERASFLEFANRSGLLTGRLAKGQFKRSHRMRGSIFILLRADLAEHFAQLLAAYLCDRLIAQQVKFSFETVFSHASKIEFMRRAKEKGYKVYLYYICTNAPEINVDRVKSRVRSGGHAVPATKIKARYRKSLEQLLPAIEYCYHAFMFDNTNSPIGASPEPVMFAEMKRVKNAEWWGWSPEKTPDWFLRDFLLPSPDPIKRHMADQVFEVRDAGHGQ